MIRGPGAETTSSPPSVSAGEGESESKLRGSVYELTASIYIGTAVGLVTGPLLARGLGPTYRGELAAILVATEWMLLTFTLGIPDAVAASATRAPYATSSLLAAAKRHAALTLVVFACAAPILLYGPFADVSARARTGLVLLLLFAPFGIYAMSVEQVLRARGWLRPLAQMRVIPFLVHGGAVVAAWAVLHLSLDVIVWARVVGVLLALWIGRRSLALEPSERAPFAPLLAFGVRSHLGRLAGFANVRLDQIVLFSLLGAEPLGYYAVATTVAALPAGLAEALASRAFGEIARVPREDRGVMAMRCLRRAVLPLGIAGIAFELLGPGALRLLFGLEFAPAVAPLRILVPGFVFYGLAHVSTACAIALGHPSIFMIAQIVGLAVTLTLLPILVPHYGVLAVASVSTTSYLFMAMTSAVLLQRAVRRSRVSVPVEEGVV